MEAFAAYVTLNVFVARYNETKWDCLVGVSFAIKLVYPKEHFIASLQREKQSHRAVGPKRSAPHPNHDIVLGELRRVETVGRPVSTTFRRLSKRCHFLIVKEAMLSITKFSLCFLSVQITTYSSDFSISH